MLPVYVNNRNENGKLPMFALQDFESSFAAFSLNVSSLVLSLRIHRFSRCTISATSLVGMFTDFSRQMTVICIFLKGLFHCATSLFRCRSFRYEYLGLLLSVEVWKYSNSFYGVLYVIK
jgi:hypothetical protein